MDEVAMGCSQIFAESGKFFVVSESCPVEAKVPLNKVIDEVVLLPRVDLGTEWRRELEISGQTDVKEPIQLFERTPVIRFSHFPWVIGQRKQIFLAKVLDQSDMTTRIIVKNLGDIQAVLSQEVCHGQEEAIVLTLHRVVNSNERRMPVSLEPNNSPPRSPPFDGLENNGVIRLELQVGTNGSEEGVGGHEEKRVSAV